VADNLLSNAVKFTPAGGRVAVELRLQAPEAALTVRDSGIGIPSGLLPHVFEPLQQGGGETTSRAGGGLGLGLTIVRHLVEAHGGTIEAASDGEGRGATFHVRLPAGPDAGAAAPWGGFS
jgi:signal transduction histidine kinase